MTKLASIAPEVQTSSEQLSVDLSCEPSSPLHEQPHTAQLKAIALQRLAEAEEALREWRQAVETGALYGDLHQYPHEGTTRYNYYPHESEVEPGKRRKRTYVRQGLIRTYRLAIAKGKTANRVRAAEQQTAHLMQEVRRIA